MQMLEISPGKETNYKPEVSNIYAIHPTEFFFSKVDTEKR